MASPNEVDAALVQSALRGDEQAFATLVAKYHGLVLRFLIHFTGNVEEAEDITQETFLKFFAKMNLHNPAHALAGWLVTMARNLAISHHRKRHPTPIAPETLAAVIKTTAASPESETLARAETEELHQCLQGLPENLREVLVLRYIMGIPLQDVADLLGIPPGTAKSRCFAARTELRAALDRLENRAAAASGGAADRP